MISRRSLLAGIAAAPVAAPALVKAAAEPRLIQGAAMLGTFGKLDAVDAAYIDSLANYDAYIVSLANYDAAMHDYRASLAVVRPADVIREFQEETLRLAELGIADPELRRGGVDPLSQAVDDETASMLLGGVG